MNSFEPLSEEAYAQLQSEINDTYDMFVGSVARNRNTTKGDVLDNFGQGRMLNAKDALSAGMVDGVETFEQTLARLQTSLGGEVTAKAQATTEWGTMWANTTTASSNIEFELALQPYAAAIPAHSTQVVDKPWDGPAAQAKVKAAKGPLRALHAWVDSSGDPNAKGSYKFPHHEVGDNGTPGPANINGVNNAMARLSNADIPAGDRAGVQAHLNRHQEDYKGEKEPDSDKDDNAKVFEARDSLRGYLGLSAAPDEPAGLVADAPEAVSTDPLAALKEQSAASMQRAREDKVRITKKMFR
jgi:hypothetical protein